MKSRAYARVDEPHLLEKRLKLLADGACYVGGSLGGFVSVFDRADGHSVLVDELRDKGAGDVDKGVSLGHVNSLPGVVDVSAHIHSPGSASSPTAAAEVG